MALPYSSHAALVRRYFLVEPGRLQYFTNNDVRGRARGIRQLGKATVEAVEHPKYPHCFRIVWPAAATQQQQQQQQQQPQQQQGDELLIRADSEAEQKQWLASLEAAVEAGGLRYRVRAFYRKHNPDKIGDVDALIAKFKGKDEDLLARLEKKYGSSSSSSGGSGGSGSGGGGGAGAAAAAKS